MVPWRGSRSATTTASAPSRSAGCCTQPCLPLSCVACEPSLSTKQCVSRGSEGCAVVVVGGTTCEGRGGELLLGCQRARRLPADTDPSFDPPARPAPPIPSQCVPCTCSAGRPQISKLTRSGFGSRGWQAHLAAPSPAQLARPPSLPPPDPTLHASAAPLPSLACLPARPARRQQSRA